MSGDPLPCDSITTARSLKSGLSNAQPGPLLTQKQWQREGCPQGGGGQGPGFKGTLASLPALLCQGIGHCGLQAGEEGRGREAALLPDGSPFPAPAHTVLTEAGRLMVELKFPRGCETQSPCFVSVSDRSLLLLCYYY